MTYEYTDISELRAKYLTEPVTLAFTDNPDAFAANGSKQITDFISGEGWLMNIDILCIRFLKETKIGGFHNLDEKIKYLKGYHLIMIHPIQEIMADPYDQQELDALYAVATGWAEETGAKIVLILDKCFTSPFD